MKKLSDSNHKILSYLYQLRVLSYNEIKEFIFEDKTKAYLDKVMKALVSEGYVDKTGHFNKESSYQILNKGIQYLKSYGSINVGSGKTVNVNPAIAAHKLRIKNQNVNHQLALNHFVLMTTRKKGLLYFDEKFISRIISGVRPDGLLVYKDSFAFLEMDMNTERERALSAKWEHYRTYLRSQEFYDMKKGVMVMFILGGGVNDQSKRGWFLRKQILENLPDALSPKFNVLVGTEEKILSFQNSKNKPEISDRLREKGFDLYSGAFKDDSTNGIPFELFIKKTNSEGRLIYRSAEAEEYLVEDLTNLNLFSLYKITSFDAIQSTFHFKYGRYIKLIEVVESEDVAYRICKELGEFNSHIFFTTLARLQSSNLYEALFQVDERGERWHFSPGDLRIRVYET